MKKQCAKCKKRKFYFEFYKRLAAKDGFNYCCKECCKKYQREFQKKYDISLRGYLMHRWHSILERCNNPKYKQFKDYGGRGIKCLFKSFEDFFSHVTIKLGFNTYQKLRGLQIDRIDNDGNYEKGNIRFVTPKVNRNNRRIK